jgi:hypothetical protein
MPRNMDPEESGYLCSGLDGGDNSALLVVQRANMAEASGAVMMMLASHTVLRGSRMKARGGPPSEVSLSVCDLNFAPKPSCRVTD